MYPEFTAPKGSFMLNARPTYGLILDPSVFTLPSFWVYLYMYPGILWNQTWQYHHGRQWQVEDLTGQARVATHKKKNLENGQTWLSVGEK